MQSQQPAASPTQQQQQCNPTEYHSDSSSRTPPPAAGVVALSSSFPNPSTTLLENLCYGCGMTAAVQGGKFCSRRCSWLVSGQCPHCGKNKADPSYVYCCRHCIHQASQANWCSICGVCQTNLNGSCCNQHCAGSHNGNVHTPEAMMMMMMNGCFIPQNVPTPQLSLGGHQRGGRNANRMECRVMNSSEMSRSGLPSVFSAMWSSGLGVRIVSAIKLTASSHHRKRYLSYRSVVENQMTSEGMAKYGHGGEGNEQRRYFGVSLKCNLGSDSSAMGGPMAPAAIGGGQRNQQGGAAYSHHNQHSAPRKEETFSLPSLRTCHDPACSACCVVSRGFDLHAMGLGSHYCNTTSTAAAQYLESSPASNLRALVVARVVVGNPEVHVLDATTPAPFIQAPQDPTQHHSLVLTNNDTHYDGTYVFSDEAVDPQYLVLFE